MENNGIRLSQLNTQIKTAVKAAFDAEIWIVAEISELRCSQNGHCYLELIEKDDASDKIIAKAKANIWSYTFRILQAYFETTTGQQFASGIKVLVKVSVEFSEVYGFSLQIKDIDPVYTLGDIDRKRKEIIRKLEEEGVFYMNKDLEFPAIPKSIALVSSPTAAGYEDFVNQLENNAQGYRFHCKLFSATMQGERAEESIIKALDCICKYEDVFDLVVMIRGGGSQADLNCFDSYWLASNVAQFPLPVVSGIGHERDESIVDLVANLSVKTPTAAAQYLIDCFDRRQVYHEELHAIFSASIVDALQKSSTKLQDLKTRFLALVKHVLSKNAHKLLLADEKLAQLSKQFTRLNDMALRNLKIRFTSEIEHHLHREKKRINSLKGDLKDQVLNFMEKHKQEISYYERGIHYLNPETILKKGYSLTLKNGEIVKNIGSLSTNDLLETRFRDGVVKSKIVNINKPNG